MTALNHNEHHMHTHDNKANSSIRAGPKQKPVTVSTHAPHARQQGNAPACNVRVLQYHIAYLAEEPGQHEHITSHFQQNEGGQAPVSINDPLAEPATSTGKCHCLPGFQRSPSDLNHAEQQTDTSTKSDCGHGLACPC